jgi:hypothetical protein
VWSSGGKVWDHSIEELRLELNRAGRLATILSQRMKRKNKTAIRETRDPIEEIVFQVV